MSTTETPAGTIRRAAAKMRELAEMATCDGMSPSPWRAGEAASCHCCKTITDATGSHIATTDDRQSGHIASWHPVASLAVADWLDAEAERADDMNGYEDSAAWPLMLAGIRLPLNVARAYLGES